MTDEPVQGNTEDNSEVDTEVDTEVDAVLVDLRRIAATADPVPELVTVSAKAAFATRRLDAELAELLADSDLIDAGEVRAADDEVRLLSFETADVSVDLQVEYTGGQVSVRGLVSGTSGDAVIEVAGQRHPVSVDTDGWFVVAGLPRGATRVVVTAESGTEVATSWVVF